MIQTKSAGGVVINNNNKFILVVRNGKSSWSLPKGHIEEGEDIVVAAKREIFEESGIRKLEYIKELGSYKRHPIDKNGSDDMSELKEITLFLFKTEEDYLQPVDPENPEARWVNFDDVADMLIHPSDKEFFLLIKDELR